MKKLNILEASKIHDAEFEVYYYGGIKRSGNIKVNQIGYLYEALTDEPADINNELLYAYFVRVNKSITLQEAAAYLESGKKVKSITDGIEKIYEPSEKGFIEVSYKEIVSGKWYLMYEE